MSALLVKLTERTKCGGLALDLLFYLALRCVFNSYTKKKITWLWISAMLIIVIALICWVNTANHLFIALTSLTI